MKGLDEYITGGRYHTFEDTMICPECRNQWQVKFANEYGQTYLVNDDDGICSKCQADGMTIVEYERWCKKYENQRNTEANTQNS